MNFFYSFNNNISFRNTKFIDAGHEFRQFFIDLEKLVLELDYVPKEEYKRLMKGGVGK